MWYTVLFQFLAAVLGVLAGIKLARRKILAEKLAEGAVTKFFEYADTRARLRQGLDEWIGGEIVRDTWNPKSEAAKALRDLGRIARQIAIAAPQYGRAAIDQVKALENLIGRIDAGEVRDAALMLADVDKAYSALEESIGKLTRV